MLNFRLSDYVSRHTTSHITLPSMFTSIARFRPSIIAFYDIKRPFICANSMPPTQTSQIIHLLVLTTSSEYMLILAGLAW